MESLSPLPSVLSRRRAPCNLYPLCRFLRPPPLWCIIHLAKRNPSDGPNVYSSTCEIIHLCVPAVAEKECAKQQPYLLRRGWIIHWLSLLGKKKKEVHLIGAINEILMKCATYGAKWKITSKRVLKWDFSLSAAVGNYDYCFFTSALKISLWKWCGRSCVFARIVSGGIRAAEQQLDRFWRAAKTLGYH